MKLKYYLKGIGIGILLTAAVFHFGGAGKAQSMTDSEIKARAARMGMVENKKLLTELEEEQADGSDAQESIKAESPEESKAAAGVNTAGGETRDSESEPGGASAEEDNLPEGTEGSSEAPPVGEKDNPAGASGSAEPEDNAEPAETDLAGGADRQEAVEVTVTVRKGEGSEVVSRRVEEAGLVESAAAFNAYLCDNGYSKRLVAGEHRIPEGASEAEIARKLTGR